MADASFRIFGMGLGPDHLHYIGWTRRPISDASDVLFDLMNSKKQIASWVEEAIGTGRLSIFEIEAVSSAGDAAETVRFWGQCYALAGAKVLTDYS